jgi:hypothetical protein
MQMSDPKKHTSNRAGGGLKRGAVILAARLLPGLLLAVFVLLVVAGANPSTTTPSRDGGSYLYTGRLILRGALPYVDAWDSKPPGIFYLNALGLWLGHDTRWGVWLLEFIFVYGATLCGYGLMKKLWQPGAAIIGTILWLWGLALVFWKGNLVEEYPLLFNFVALFLFWLGDQNPKSRRFDFLIGAMAVLSFLFRANNIGVEVSIALVWVVVGILKKQYLLAGKRLLAMLVGGLLVLSAAGLYFWRLGIAGAAWNAAILYNFKYIGKPSNIFSSIIPGFKYLGPVAWIALMGYGINVYLFVSRKIKEKAFQPVILFMIVSWPIEIVFSSLSGRGYTHYFVSWLPSIALLGGFLFSAAASLVLSGKVIGFLDKEAPPLGLIALFALIINPATVVGYYQSATGLLFHRAGGVEMVNPVSSYVTKNTGPNDTVLDWGNAGINYMSKRNSPTAYLWYPEYLPSSMTPTLTEGFYNDLTSHPPALIVDSYIVAPDDILSLDPDTRATQEGAGKGTWAGQADNLDQVLEFIKTHYEIEKGLDNYAIYRLK